MEYNMAITMRMAVLDRVKAEGGVNPNRPWILSQYDTWERNPYYQGPPVPHPEDDMVPEEPPAGSLED